MTEYRRIGINKTDDAMFFEGIMFLLFLIIRAIVLRGHDRSLQLFSSAEGRPVVLFDNNVNSIQV